VTGPTFIVWILCVTYSITIITVLLRSLKFFIEDFSLTVAEEAEHAKVTFYIAGASVNFHFVL